MEYSRKMMAMGVSSVRKLNKYADQAKAQGKKVYHLNIGQPDLLPPPAYFEKVRAFNGPTLDYMPSPGIPALVQKAKAYYERRGIFYDEKEIMITAGGTEAVLFALLAIINEGDEVLTFEPYYSNYETFFTISGAKCVAVNTKPEDNFHFKPEDVEKKITDKTKVLMVISPGNPTGAVFTKEEIQFLADLAVKHDLFIISDEVYREMVFDGREMASFGHVKGIEDRLIIVDSVSKRYNACGARIGMLLTKNEELRGIFSKLCQGRLSVSTLEQQGALGLLDADDDYIFYSREQFQKRRNVVAECLDKIPGVQYKKPEGAFYMVCGLPVPDATEFLIWVLTEFDIDGETVMMAPADGFYKTEGLGKNQVRIAFVLEEPEMRKAMRILEEGLKAYPKK